MCEIIAEIGASHEQSFQKAVALIHTAKKVGADTVKFQMFQPDDMTLNLDDKRFRITRGPWNNQTLYELYDRISMPYEWIPRLREVADAENINFFVSVYHPDTVDIAERMGIQRYKVSSFEIAYSELLQRLRETGKPVVVSTGSATFREIQNVVKMFPKESLTLLHCTSSYPTDLEKMNLKTMTAMAHRFNVPCGLSDHSLGIIASVTAVSMGAVIIEKHLTLGKGVDNGFAVTPDIFFRMVETIRGAEKAIGKIDYGGKKSFHRKEVDGKMVRVVH